MAKGTQAASLDSGSLESAVEKLRGLSQESQATVASIINRLALGEVAYSRNSNFYTEHGTQLYTRASMLRAVDLAVALRRPLQRLGDERAQKLTQAIESTRFLSGLAPYHKEEVCSHKDRGAVSARSLCQSLRTLTGPTDRARILTTPGSSDYVE